MADIKFSCPHCTQHAVGDEALSGMAVKCPTCAKQFTVVPEMRPSKSSQSVSPATAIARDQDSAKTPNVVTSASERQGFDKLLRSFFAGENTVASDAALSAHRDLPSLVLCADCKREISSKAKSCPHCGSPRARRLPVGRLALVCGGVLALLIWGIFGLTNREKTQTNQLSREFMEAWDAFYAEADELAAMTSVDAKRDEFAIKQRKVIAKRDKFLSLSPLTTFEDQENFTNAIAMWKLAAEDWNSESDIRRRSVPDDLAKASEYYRDGKVKMSKYRK